MSIPIRSNLFFLPHRSRPGAFSTRFCRRLTGALLLLCLSAHALAQAVDTPMVDTVASGLQFPEGTVFVGNTLYFVDYARSAVLRIAAGEVQTVWHRDGCGANGLVQSGANLLVACYDSNSIVEITTDGQAIGTIAADDKGNPLVHPNDLTDDRHGGVYFTASGSANTPGKVFNRDAGHHVREIATAIRYANGVAVSPDGKVLYVAESEASRVLSFAIDGSGQLGERRIFFAAPTAPGAASGIDRFTPDGVRTDARGNVFVAQYDGGGFLIFSSDGRPREQVRLPGHHHSNLAISPDNQFIFVTSIDDDSSGAYHGELLRVRNPLAR
jgi:gluconolactonase